MRHLVSVLLLTLIAFTMAGNHRKDLTIMEATVDNIYNGINPHGHQGGINEKNDPQHALISSRDNYGSHSSAGANHGGNT
ncbi:hypothetical protein NMG60_11015675 [Bertholletia excelsa]